MILPIIAKIFQQDFNTCHNSRMTGHYTRKFFRMGKAGKLVQVAGYAFELGHAVEMFAAQTSRTRLVAINWRRTSVRGRPAARANA